MANVKISELPQASVVNDNDIIPIVQNGETMQAEILAITEQAKAGIIISITTNTSIFDLDSGLYNLQADLLLDGTGKIQPNTNNNFLLIKKNNATTFQFTLYDIGYITFGLATNGGGNNVYKKNISEIEETTNKTSEITSASTSTEYPSAEAVYDALIQKEDIANKTSTINQASTSEQYANAQALYNYLDLLTIKGNASGEFINVQDSLPLPPKERTILGNATQQTYTGKNLLNVESVTLNAYFDSSTGDVINDTSKANCVFNDYIPVNEGTTYIFKINGTVTASSIISYCEYDTDKNFLHYYSNTSVSSVTISPTSGTKYVRFRYKYQNNYQLSVDFLKSQKLQLETGSTATSYEPYVRRQSFTKPRLPTRHTRCYWR